MMSCVVKARNWVAPSTQCLTYAIFIVHRVPRWVLRNRSHLCGVGDGELLCSLLLGEGKSEWLVEWGFSSSEDEGIVDEGSDESTADGGDDRDVKEIAVAVGPDCRWVTVHGSGDTGTEITSRVL